MCASNNEKTDHISPFRAVHHPKHTEKNSDFLKEVKADGGNIKGGSNIWWTHVSLSSNIEDVV